MTTTATAIENFAKTIKKHSAKKVGNAAEIIQNIKQVKEKNLPVYDDDKIKVFLTQRAKALSILIDNLIVTKLSEQYHMLDNSLFKLKRHLYLTDGVLVEDKTLAIAKKNGLTHVECPLFLHVPINDKTVEVAKIRKTESYWGNGYFNEKKRRQIITSITANVPEVPLTVMLQARKALGYYHKIISDIYDNEITNDLYVEEASPTLEIIWIPTVESLNVKVDTVNIPAPKNYDPALLLKREDRYFLVGLWETDDELPFENILREFTVGNIKFPKKD